MAIHKVYPLAIEQDYPEAAESVNACRGPIEQELGRRGMLGLFGRKQTITICGGLTQANLNTIARREFEWSLEHQEDTHGR